MALTGQSVPPIYGHVRPTVNDFDFINDDYGVAVAGGGLSLEPKTAATIGD